MKRILNIIILSTIFLVSSSSIFSQVLCYSIDRSRAEWPTDPVSVETQNNGEKNVLRVNIPNPFNSETEIIFSVADAGPALLQVVDMEGRIVKTLLDSDIAPGEQSITWDGRNSSNVPVTSGTYIVRLTIGNKVYTSKMKVEK